MMPLQHAAPSWTEKHMGMFYTKLSFLPIVRMSFLILVWYVLGISLTFYNKMLLGKDSRVFNHEPFPAPLFLAGTQFALQHMLARFVFFTGLIKRTSEPRSWLDWLKKVVPNGVCTGLDIAFSMMSLVFISLSFYTMCKASVPLFLLAFAFMWGVEKPSWRLGLVVLIISSGLVMLVRGEAQFDVVGFTLVMVAACLAGLRFTLTQVFLQGHHGTAAQGGPLEILEALTLVMSGIVLLMSLVWERLWVTLPKSVFFESFAQATATWGLLLAGAVIAFLLVWTEYRLIKETSALTFMIASTCKEIFTVLLAVTFMGDTFTAINGVGLAIVIVGVVLFNLYKLQKLKKGEIVLEVTTGDGKHEVDRDDGEQEMQPLMKVDVSSAGTGEGSPDNLGVGSGRRPPIFGSLSPSTRLGPTHNRQ